MQLRVSRVSRNGKTYEYAQLVESFRGPNGVPSHRVISHLGALSSLEVDNLKAALAAARRGKRVSADRQRPASAIAAYKPADSLRYLDAAVLVALWREWGLGDLVADAMPPRDANVCDADVVAALCIQRCLDPGSELSATRWFPRSALPELLDIAPTAFNNTRLHRVLDGLDTATPTLMGKLPRRYVERDGPLMTLFLDVTDTWFFGHGPEDIAHFGKTKEGMLRRKIGIVLLCNERGYPLRWQVVDGTQHDSIAMTSMLESIRGLSWLGEAPVVCDRAMGKTANISALLKMELRFLTALTVNEFGAYATRLPYQPFLETDPPSSQAPDQVGRRLQELSERAVAAGFEKVDDSLFVLDLDIVERDVEPPTAAQQRGVEASTAQAMRLCREMCEAVACGRRPSYAAAGRALGLRKGAALKYAALRGLNEQIQRDILAGKAPAASLGALLAISRLGDADEQLDAFAKLRADDPSSASPEPASTPTPQAAVAPLQRIKVRAVAYFNPQRFIVQRDLAQRQLAELKAFADTLNQRLTGPRAKLTRAGVVAAVDRELRRRNLLDAFTVEIKSEQIGGRERLKVQLLLQAAQWQRRRRYDGFSVLVAHPALGQTAAELCQLYRAKDAVEKDFQVIKGLIELRPVWHQNKGKVRAHVTICMLALWLERALAHSLKVGSAKAALEVLEGCRLNRYTTGPTPLYASTSLTPEQDKILRTLGLRHLADDEETATRLHPR